MTKDEVIDGSLWQVTIYAAFQRAQIYSEAATDEDKKGLKQTLGQEIRKRLRFYKKPVSGEKHSKRILEVANRVNARWGSVLLENAIPIGVVQKALNLYLKLLWCMDRIPEPPHCPVDKVIIDKLPNKRRASWTRIRDIQTYDALILELRKLADKQGKTLATWELEAYEKP